MLSFIYGLLYAHLVGTRQNYNKKMVFKCQTSLLKN